MKLINIPLLALVALSSTTVYSQDGTAQADSLKMDVTFVGEREMVVKDALKLQSWPEYRTLEAGNKEFSYRLLAKRMNVIPEWTRIEPIRLRVDAPLSHLYRGYARAGYGLYNTPLLELSLTDLRSREGTWGIQASHFATDAPLGFVEDRFQDSHGGVWLSRFIGKERVDLEGNVDRKNIVYYGNALSDSLAPDTMLGLSNRLLNFRSSIALKSHNRDSTDVNHDIKIDASQLRDLSGTVENNINGLFSFGKFVGQERFSINGSINIDQLTIGIDNPDTVRTDQAIVGLEPIITTYRGPLTLSTGAGLWIDADAQSRVGAGSTFHFYPKIEASYRILRNVFVPYVRLDGGLEQNRLETVIKKNPFYYYDLDSELRTTSRSSDIQLGMRGTITSDVSFQVYTSTTKYEDYMYFLNDSTLDGGARFRSLYDTLTVKSIGGHLTLNIIENLDLRLAGAIFKYDANGLDAAWNLPASRWSVDAKYKFLEQFTVDASIQVIGSSSALSQVKPLENAVEIQGNNYLVTIPSYIDANLGLEYRYNSRTAVWLRLSNLTNASYRQWVGYPVQGFQALFGASHAF